MGDEDDKLNELRDILMGTKTGQVVPLEARTMVAARASLPGELRPQFDALAADFHAAACEIGPGALPDYWILADLVKAGWRKLGARG
jgi:hypothetical protein